MSALVVRGLRVTLGRREILSGVDLTVDEGEIVGVFGPSGAGKSTLFAALAGEIAPGGGSVHLLGEEASGPLWARARRGLGYLPQAPSVLWDLTVEENVRVFASTRPSPPAEDWLARLGLQGRKGTRASSLSGGERRRLELARVLIGEPRVLLCDEPFAALDPEGSERVGAELRALAGRGAAVVLADHRIGLALACADRACLLVEGQVAAEAEAKAFLEHPRVRALYAAPQSL